MRDHIEATIEEVLIGRRQKISRKALQDTVQGMWIVAIGLRQSFLLETVQLDERDCVSIGERFQANPPFSHMTMIYEPRTGSAFALNLDVYRDLYVRRDRYSTLAPIVLDISSPGFWLNSDITSNRHIRLLDERLRARPRSVTLAIDKPEEFPELAGILLEYPFIYSVSVTLAGGKTRLDGAPLMLYRVSLKRRDLGPVQMMSFTCPHNWNTKRSHADLSTAMKELYNERLAKSIETGRLRAEEGFHVEVTTERIRLERVVL